VGAGGLSRACGKAQDIPITPLNFPFADAVHLRYILRR
jgi:hypothetical protein